MLQGNIPAMYKSFYLSWACSAIWRQKIEMSSKQIMPSGKEGFLGTRKQVVTMKPENDLQNAQPSHPRLEACP